MFSVRVLFLVIDRVLSACSCYWSCYGSSACYYCYSYCDCSCSLFICCVARVVVRRSLFLFVLLFLFLLLGLVPIRVPCSC